MVLQMTWESIFKMILLIIIHSSYLVFQVQLQWKWPTQFGRAQDHDGETWGASNAFGT